MNIPQVEKKVREAWFFLSKMAKHEGLAFGDREPFDFYLSAFLNAARTVDYRLRHEQAVLYKPWKTKWDATLTTAENTLIKHLVDDRALEVHESGSKRAQKTVEIPIGNIYQDASGTAYSFGPPGASASVHKPCYFFTIDGTDQKVVDVCAQYVRLLDRMVNQFKADHP